MASYTVTCKIPPREGITEELFEIARRKPAMRGTDQNRMYFYCPTREEANLLALSLNNIYRVHAEVTVQ